MSLSPEGVLLFRHNGFLKLPTPLPEETVGKLKDTILRQVRDGIEPAVRDAEGNVTRISQIWDRAPIFQEVVTSALVLDPLVYLLGANIEFVKNRHNHSTLRRAGEKDVYFHRDVLQWSRTIITVIFYLEDATVENGCTRVVPGSHLLLPGKPLIDLLKDEQLIHAGILDQAVPVPMPAGGMLAIDSMILHSVGPNNSDKTRMSMTAGYCSVDELSRTEIPNRVLVRGERVYMGNDQY